LTVLETLKLGELKLSNAGITSSKLDSELLLMEVLKVNKAKLILLYNEEIDFLSENKYFQYIDRRSKCEPVAYILGKQIFMGLEFDVNKFTLIPRDDTEILVSEVLKLFSKDDVLNILDMCTGSGCIAISLAKFLAKSNILGVDISDKALEVSKKNSAKNGVETRVKFVQSNLFENIEKDEKYDLIVSNPPYIKSELIKLLDKDVLCYEPKLALDGGESGTMFYDIIVKESIDYLKDDGILAFEIDCTYYNYIEDMLRKYGYYQIELFKDLAGLDRVVIARRKKCLIN